MVPRLLITGRRVCGSSFGGLKGRDDVPALVRRYLDGEIDVDPFISHRLELSDINRGFELMEAQDGIRSVIELEAPGRLAPRSVGAVHSASHLGAPEGSRRAAPAATRPPVIVHWYETPGAAGA